MESNTDKNSKNNGATSPWYRSAVTTAIVCAVFSLIVLTFFVINYIRGRIIDANWEVQSLNLKKEFGQNSDDEKLLAKIRQLDLQFRQHRIRRLDFSRKGGYLLLGSVVIMLIAIKSADTFKKKLPAPDASGNRDSEQILQAKFSRWAVAAGLAIFGSGALILAMGTDIDFGRTNEQVSQNWPGFRGPEGLGIVTFTNIPDSWNGKSGEGILWKTRIPLPGKNSPVVWGDRIFLSGGDPNGLRVFCFDGRS
jgi:hypothetical protein